MDKNTAIGIVLIMLLFLLYLRLQKPSEEELAAMERMRDSIAQVDEPLVSQDTASQPKPNLQKVAPKSDIQATQDTGIVQKKQVLQNDLIQIEINNKGGVISGVLLKQYEQYIGKTEEKEPVVLLENNRNTFEYLFSGLPASNGTAWSFDEVKYFIGSRYAVQDAL